MRKRYVVFDSRADETEEDEERLESEEKKV